MGVYESGSLTYYIQLSHTVFDAAAIACYTCVPASIVRGDICNEQGAVGHLLKPGRKKWDIKTKLLSNTDVICEVWKNLNFTNNL